MPLDPLRRLVNLSAVLASTAVAGEGPGSSLFHISGRAVSGRIAGAAPIGRTADDAPEPELFEFFDVPKSRSLRIGECLGAVRREDFGSVQRGVLGVRDKLQMLGPVV